MERLDLPDIHQKAISFIISLVVLLKYLEDFSLNDKNVQLNV